MRYSVRAPEANHVRRWTPESDCFLRKKSVHPHFIQHWSPLQLFQRTIPLRIWGYPNCPCPQVLAIYLNSCSVSTPKIGQVSNAVFANFAFLDSGVFYCSHTVLVSLDVFPYLHFPYDISEPPLVRGRHSSLYFCTDKWQFGLFLFFCKLIHFLRRSWWIPVSPASHVV